MRVEHGKRPGMIETGPGADTVLTAPGIASSLRGIAEPEVPRLGRLQIPEKQRRELTALLSIQAPNARPSVVRKHCLQVVKLIDQHLLKTRYIGTIGVENLRDEGAPVFPDVVTVPGFGITEVEAQEAERTRFPSSIHSLRVLIS